MQKNKLNFKKFSFLILSFLIFIGAYFICSNNYSLYKKEIVKVTSSSNISSNQKSGTNGEYETYYIQRLSCIIMNGNNKGKTLTIDNEYSYSSVITSKYKKNNELFVSLKKNNGKLTATVTGEKRDKYIILLLLIFSYILILSAGKRGLFTLISFIINTVLLCGSVIVFGSGAFINGLWIPVVVLFSVITIIFAVGLNKKTVSTILSTLCTILLISLLFYISIYSNYKLTYESMEYVVAFLSLKNIYLISIIIGSLGAVMDVSVTINSGIYEIIDSCNNKIELKQLTKSIREISYDIMGTMMNVMFFSYLCGSVPLIILKISNNIGFNIIFGNDLIFDFIRFLISSIAIVLTIPVSAIISVLIFKKGLKIK